MVSAPAVPSFARAAELMEEFVEEARARGDGAPVLLAGTPPHCCLVLYHCTRRHSPRRCRALQLANCAVCP
jgi:hypothetical protein